MPLPPIDPPTDGEDSLGPDKQDEEEVYDRVHFLYARQWNRMKEYVKWFYAAIQQITMTGSVGTLEGAYQNYAPPNVAPCRIHLNSTQGGIIVTDYAGGLGSLLFGVSRDDGTDSYGFWANGLQLNSEPAAIFTGAGVPVQMLSGQTLGAQPAYVLDTDVELGLSQSILTLRTFGIDVMRVNAGGQLAVYDKTAPGFLLYSFLPDRGSNALRLTSAYAAYRALMPQADSMGSLGDSSNHWGGIYSTFFGTRMQTLIWAASVSINVSLGAYVALTLGGNTTITAISGGQSGTVVTLKLTQDGTGGRKLTMPGSVKTRGPFGLSPGAGLVDYLILQSDGANWIEIGRQLAQDLDRRNKTRDITAGGTIELKVGQDEKTQVLYTTTSLGASYHIDLAPGSNGDEWRLIFTEQDGVETTTVRGFSISPTGGANLTQFTLNKTMRGIIICYHDGTAWQVSIGNLSYT